MNLRKTLSFSYTGKSSRNGSLLCHEMISGWLEIKTRVK